MSELIVKSIKESIGLRIGLFNFKDWYFEGIVVDCDDEFLKLNDRKVGMKLIPLSEIKEVSLK